LSILISSLEDLPVASRTRVVPVSTIPAVEFKIVCPPYVTDWSIPQNCEAGLVEVIGTKLTEDVVLDVSMPPNVSSPLEDTLAGS
jgi:hypothetical protein